MIVASRTTVAPGAPGGAPTSSVEHQSQDRTDIGADVFHAVSRIGFAGTILSWSRMIAAIPTAQREGKLPKLLFSMAPLIGPGANVDVVPYEHGLWKAAYRASNVLGTAMLFASPMIAGPNLIAGWQQGGGPAGLIDTKAGRTGVITSVGPALTVAVMGIAAVAARHEGATGMLKSIIDSPLRGNFKLGIVGAMMGPLTIANEAGCFDFADQNSDVNVPDAIVSGVKNVPHTILHIYTGA